MDDTHEINLNIHYTAPDEVWEKINSVYESMPYWAGTDSMPSWIGDNIDLTASVESSGVKIYGDMPEQIWNTWYELLKEKLTDVLGYEIGEPEEGYQFKYWEPFIKSYSDIKSIDKDAIVFNDFSTFVFDELGNGYGDITAKPPYFLFATEYIELRIVFNKTGLFAERENINDYHELIKRLNEIGQGTKDFS